MAKDPVCRMDLREEDAAAKTTYNGKEYFFCSNSCKVEFEKDPEKYVNDQKEHLHQVHHRHGNHGCC
ncbi:YHS domain-containing protein [Thermoanaerobacterium sp. RBIITD]|uniref:YHS domain-containing protein n=1 Tax=Thermoanaerobacterium sp. RBIITD TaxID=1550240 RepID=UPI000BB67783|nr:YHS domain-containing protein [Thermoanaerobacterium sp. RBIITD]SNX54794.1 YHS domain-containing protein [Thermoanaerobacterium sp. RBIITD]